jgi:choline dehydrogenase-like flavoprotein
LSIVDAKELDLPARLDTDICIVGAGAAGLTLAARLQAAGREVCLVESGGFTPDEGTQSLHDLESVGYPIRPNFMSRARYFGGTCNLWAGRSMVLNPLDFEARDWVPRSGWPISYEEIARYHSRAFDILELPGQESVSRGVLDTRMSAAERQLFEDETFAPTVSLWAKSATRFGSTFGKQLRDAKNARVLLNASVTRLALNEAGDRVESISASTLAGGRLEIRAHQFVLACGGLENARLLLVSRDRRPAGVANDHDMVGRCYMDHPRTVFGKVHLPASSQLPLLRGRPLPDGKLQVGVGLSARTQQREKLLNHYATFELETSSYAAAQYQSFIQTMKVVLRKGYAGSRWNFARSHLTDIPDLVYLLSPKELMPHFLYRAFVAAREAVPRRPTPRTFVVVYFCEQPPDLDSRVTLSEETDRLGVNKLRLDWHIDDSVTEGVLRMQQLLGRELERTGVGTLEPGIDVPAFTDASHHTGTTRMSVDPGQGVVDPDCRAHGVANLHMAGSSVFPCAGHANPTLTIVALALRLADHLQVGVN